MDVTSRLQAEVEKVLERWDADRRGLITDDWQARVADSTLSSCSNELRAAILRAMDGGVLDGQTHRAG